MRISDEKVRTIMGMFDYNENDFRYKLAADLLDARTEIAQLKKDKAELISCIEDLKK